MIAVASGKNEALMRGLGAERFIDYTRTAPDEAVRDVDVVLDAVGGKEASRFLGSLRRGGALFPVFPLGFDARDQADRLGVTTVSATQVRSNGRQLARAAGLLDDGTVRVVIDSTFPLAQAARAHERAAKGGIQGKIVLLVE